MIYINTVKNTSVSNRKMTCIYVCNVDFPLLTRSKVCNKLIFSYDYNYDTEFLSYYTDDRMLSGENKKLYIRYSPYIKYLKQEGAID